jgi:hypothetical protein
MRSQLKPVLALITAAALAPGVVACGQTPAPTGATPSSSAAAPTASATPTPTATSSATPTTSAAVSVDQMYTKAKAALKGAESVQMRITIKADDGTTTITTRGTLDGRNQKNTVTTPSGATYSFLTVGGRTFMKGNKAFWRENMPNADPSRLAGRWVVFEAEPPEMKQDSLKEALLDDLDDWGPGRLMNTAATVTPHEVKGVRTYRAATPEGTEFVVDATTWRPVRFSTMETDVGTMVTVFSGWDTIPKYTAPTSYLEIRNG